MKNQTLERCTWVLIYGGLLAASLGLFMLRGGAALGWLLVLGGAALAGLGGVLIVLRSRRAEGPNGGP